jgi:hypothetical protein
MAGGEWRQSDHFLEARQVLIRIDCDVAAVGGGGAGVVLRDLVPLFV